MSEDQIGPLQGCDARQIHGEIRRTVAICIHGQKFFLEPYVVDQSPQVNLVLVGQNAWALLIAV